MSGEIIKICGLEKDEIEEKLSLFYSAEITFDVFETNLDASIVLEYHGTNYNQFQIQKSQISNAFSENVYAFRDMPINIFAGELLKRSNFVLSVAESLTGGAIASSIIDVSGISAHFYEGIVCYDTEAKAQRLFIDREILKKEGAVSKKTAFEMVRGLLLNPKTTLGLSATGVAGPESSEGKPVGLTYIAVGSGDFVTAFEHNFSGERNQIREKAKNMALFYLIRFLQGNILLL
jgi:nicotinamide-nucleotide amidase